MLVLYTKAKAIRQYDFICYFHSFSEIETSVFSAMFANWKPMAIIKITRKVIVRIKEPTRNIGIWTLCLRLVYIISSSVACKRNLQQALHSKLFPSDSWPVVDQNRLRPNSQPYYNNGTNITSPEITNKPETKQ